MSSRSRRQWLLAELEPRLMLAADAGVAIASGPALDNSIACDVSNHHEASAPKSALVIIDSGVDDLATFADAIPANAEMIVLDAKQDGVEQITAVLSTRSNLASVHLISHGSDGAIQLGNSQLDDANIETRRSQLALWGRAIAEGGDLLIYGCDVAATSKGQSFVNRIAAIAGVDVAASEDQTHRNDWDLEYRIGQIESLGTLSSVALDRFQGHLPIAIYAAGSTADELMELEVNGQIVDTWFVQGTDAENDRFYPYIVNIDGVSADDVRINFVNDLYDPASGIDRNLRVDRIEIDGVTYEAENPAVFSEGSWIEGQGITSGNLQTEYLNANGYFQFSSAGASGGGNNGSTIDIALSGTTGSESAQLLIDENVVQTFNNISTSGQVFSYQFSGDVTADRVRVAFINDSYTPGGFDRNLNVDYIRVDGQTYQTEASTTYSTGTWLASDGVQPGFRQSETLHSNGYFQFLADDGGNTGNNPGRFSIQPSPSNPSESVNSITIQVDRIGGSDGAVSVQYYTSDESAIAGQDYVAQSGTLNFADGQQSRTITINLINDSFGEGTETFSVILDNPIGTTLLAPRTSTVTIIDDDTPLPNYANFSNTDGLNLNGVAWASNGNLNLTGVGQRQVSSVFYETPISIGDNTSFQASFQFFIGGGAGVNGSSGLTFTLQNSAAGSDAIGPDAYWLGYELIENSIAIEFDTKRNSWDTAAREISVLTNGSVQNPVATVTSPYTLNDSREYYAWVDYNGDSDKLAVFISDSPAKPTYASLVTTIELDNFVGSQAYVGFTGANFRDTNQHIIRNFQFSLDPPAFDPPVRPQFPDGSLVKQDVITGLNQPLALDWSPDGRNFYIAEKVGVVKVQRDGGSVQTVIDISGQVNDYNDRGLIDFKIHPDLENNPYLYLLYTYDPPEVYNYSGLAGPDGAGNRAGRLMRVTLDASTGYTSIVQGSETILLGTNSTWNNFNGFVDSSVNYSVPQGGVDSSGNYIRDFINSDSQSHTVGSLAFGLDGNLFVSIGDGAGYTRVDGRALRVQDVNSLSGKILRIDPITGQGLWDNPFYTGDPNANASKVYQLGARNPWRITVDPTSGQLLIGDTGWTSYEEINTGGAAANFGWPYFEGRQGVNTPTPQYSGLSGAAAFYATADATPPVVAITHGAAGDAIVLGGYINDSDLGDYFDDSFFYNNAYEGTVRLFRIDDQGNLTDQQLFTTGAQWIVDIQQGPDGSVYYANLVTGAVGKWQFV
ncbi:DUF4347 domain-containing protein [Rubripirellula amarantea]|uniref:DUF4347 domain-containing protein n=1 Tax=Rubripirellula amarantea TaxID=2527999 RepID=UPI0013EF2BF4|nr:DUF4347 domain-containing protein [Rubripirellula amarantea]